jgi:hypothetical protein
MFQTGILYKLNMKTHAEWKYSLGLSSSVRSSSVVAWAIVAAPFSKDAITTTTIIVSPHAISMFWIFESSNGG